MKGETRIWRNIANRGQNVYVTGATYVSLPLAPGHWLPNSKCMVYREACNPEQPDWHHCDNVEACSTTADTAGEGGTLVSRPRRMNLPHTCMNLYELLCPALYQCPIPLCDGGEAYGRCPGGCPWWVPPIGTQGSLLTSHPGHPRRSAMPPGPTALRGPYGSSYKPHMASF